MSKITTDFYQSNIKTSRKKDSVYVMKYANQQMLIYKLQQENQQLKEQLKVIKKTTNELLTYLDKNKLVLNNQNILDFYINIKEILNKYIGE